MRAMLFDFPGNLVSDVSEISVSSAKWSNKAASGQEPTSVLETQRSPSPPTSTSTDTSGLAAVSDDPTQKWPTPKFQQQQDVSVSGLVADSGSRKEEWPFDLQPIPSSLEMMGTEKSVLGMEEWENMLAEIGLNDGFGYELGTSLNLNPHMNLNANVSPLSLANYTCPTDLVPLNNSNVGSVLVSPQTSSGLNSFKGTFLGGSNNGGNPQEPIFSPLAENTQINLPGLFYHQHQLQLEALEEKPQLFSFSSRINQQQQGHLQQNINASYLIPFSQQEQNLLPPLPKRRVPGVPDQDVQIPKAPFADSGQQSFSNVLVPQHFQQRQQHQQEIIDQLFKAAEAMEAGNSVHARGILARLNHQLSSPVGKPLQRAAFYFKEALQLLLKQCTTTSFNASPLDLVFKISAYKVFSEVSPFLQFVNFTSNQAFLEALEGYNQIHIMDFDIGLGGQWASFMQELTLRLAGAPSLKITAFASPSSHDPLELCLTRQNLSQFAAELNISFEFHVVNIDSLNPSCSLLGLSDKEAVGVNFPIGSTSHSVPSLLRLVKQLNPKIVVSTDCGSDGSDLPFSRHFLQALQSYSNLLDSIDAVSSNFEVVQKIERFLLKPRIESVITRRHRAGNKFLPWRTLFASLGFSPMSFSTFTETQAEYVVKKFHVRGFQVEKREDTLHLLWQRGELVSVSAWRC